MLKMNEKFEPKKKVWNYRLQIKVSIWTHMSVVGALFLIVVGVGFHGGKIEKIEEGEKEIKKM